MDTGGMSPDPRAAEREAKRKAYRAAVRAVEAKEFEKAEAILLAYVQQYPKEPDAYNYLAFSQRNLGRNDESMANYKKALELEPEHKGALEYQGELFLKLGDMTSAEANLAKLVSVCRRKCEERDMLQAAIERAKDGKTSLLEPHRNWSAGG